MLLNMYCIQLFNFVVLTYIYIPQTAKYLVTRAKGLKSPKQLRFSPKQRRNLWRTEEDRSLVEFIALHRDMQPTSSEWPGMRAQHDFWRKAAKFIKENAPTIHVRPSKLQ